LKGLRVTLVGQAMLQHDIRKFPLGSQCIQALGPHLKGDVVFTELETSMVRAEQTPHHMRQTVFFHAAPPEVLDILSASFHMNLFSAANNHAGDLGEEGLTTLLEEFEKRSLCMGGVGMDARRAALPVFLDTIHGRIGLVSFASKVPESSIARNAPNARPGVNSLSMSDPTRCRLNPMELTRMLASIKLARTGFVHPVSGVICSKADVVVVCMHNHYQSIAVNAESKMGRWKRNLAHQIIGAGADVFVAHGEPRLQGIEIYRGSPIFYVGCRHTHFLMSA